LLAQRCYGKTAFLLGVWYNTVLGGAQGSQKYGTTRSMKKM
jgi:hypothetical protein